MESSYCQHSESEADSQFSIKRSSSNLQLQKWAKGLWTEEEKVRYIAFIQFNKQLLNSRLLRRTSKIFKQMSQFVKTRSPSQCRSQNQKVYRRFKTTRKIVSAFKQEYGAERFEIAFKGFSQDPSIIFHTGNSDKITAMNTTKSLENNREFTDSGVQTESDRILVEMTGEEYESWRAFKQMRYNTAYFFQFSHFNPPSQASQ